MSERAFLLDWCARADLEVQRHIWALAHAARRLTAISEAVPGDGSLLLVTYETTDDPSAIVEHIVAQTAERTVDDAREHVVAVYYGGDDGPDIGDVAKHAGLSPDEVVVILGQTTLTVAFLGFMPGFAYLTGLDERLQLPRRASPRTRVAAGSVAIGGPYCGIYPMASPAGWHIIGRTDATLFAPAQHSTVRFAPGDCVRLIAKQCT